MLDEFSERDPAGCVHVKMIAILDELLVYVIGLHTFRAESAGEELDEIVLELHGEVGDVLARALADDEHLAEMGLGLSVTLESIFISALLLADLAVPTETLKALRLHLVSEVLRGTNCTCMGQRDLY